MKEVTIHYMIDGEHKSLTRTYGVVKKPNPLKRPRREQTLESFIFGLRVDVCEKYFHPDTKVVTVKHPGEDATEEAILLYKKEYKQEYQVFYKRRDEFFASIRFTVFDLPMILPAKSRGLYRITYPNGTVQHKHLIDQTDWDVFQYIYQDIQRDNDAELLKTWNAQKKSDFGDDFFLSESPLGKAIETGELRLPLSQGSQHTVTVEKI